MKEPEKEKPKLVYILKSQSSPQKYYVGLTTDIEKRLAAHNAGKSKYTSQYRPWILVFCAWFANHGKACEFEKYLK